MRLANLPHVVDASDSAMKPCESILLDRSEVMVTHAACVQRVEEHARARLGAKITAFLHVLEQ